MAEKLTFEQVLGYRAAIDWNECALCPETVMMDHFRDYPLTRTAGAGYEHGTVGRSDLEHQAVDRPHCRRYRLAGVALLVFHQLAQDLVLCLQVDDIGQALDSVEEILVAQGFDGVVVSAGTHRIDRRIDRSVGGHHQKDGIYALGPSFLDDLDAGNIWHADVANRDIDVTLAEPVQRFLAIGCDRNRVTGITRRIGQDLPDRGLVVNYQ